MDASSLTEQNWNAPMKRFIPLLAVTVMSFFLADFAPASADSLTWNIRNEHPNAIALEFYSVDANTAWPGDGEVFLLEDEDDHTFPLQCEAGETICYGAWVRGDSSQYWGAGKGGDQACEECCYVCDGGESPLIVISE